MIPSLSLKASTGKRYGRSLKGGTSTDIRHIVLTHAHPDHIWRSRPGETTVRISIFHANCRCNNGASVMPRFAVTLFRKFVVICRVTRLYLWQCIYANGARDANRSTILTRPRSREGVLFVIRRAPLRNDARDMDLPRYRPPHRLKFNEHVGDSLAADRS